MLDGAIQFKTLIPRLKELGMTSCALTDHGWMGGIIEFSKECKKNDIKPLIGIEAYLTENLDGVLQENKHRDNLHAVIIAKDLEGLKILYKLVSEGALHNYYYKPRVNRLKLEQLAGHAIITTACLKGVLTGELNFSKNEAGVVKTVSPSDVFFPLLSWYQDVFKDDFYIEIQDWDDETHIQLEYNKFMIGVARKRDIPIILSCDCHYLNKENYTLHQVMMAMQLKMTLENYLAGDVMRYGPHFYLKSPTEMIQSAIKWNVPEATKNTMLVAEKCNVNIKLGTFFSPKFDVTTADDYPEFIEYCKDHKHNV